MKSSTFFKLPIGKSAWHIRIYSAPRIKRKCRIVGTGDTHYLILPSFEGEFSLDLETLGTWKKYFNYNFIDNIEDCFDQKVMWVGQEELMLCCECCYS